MNQDEYITLDAAKRRQATAKVALDKAKMAYDAACLLVLKAQLAKPTEPPVGSDVRFEVKFRHGEQAYTYLALRTSEGWSVTGKRNEGKTFTWDQVLHIADRGIENPNIQVRKPSS